MGEFVKLFIHHGYDLVESGPADRVGTYRGHALFRLRFIPFHYATPTADDVVVGRRDPEFNGHFAFECPRRGGIPVSQLHQHGGRYALIVMFTPGPLPHVGGPWFPGREDILSSLALASTDQRPGRIYFAAPTSVRPPEIMAALASSHPSYQFELVHPRPRAAARPARKTSAGRRVTSTKTASSPKASSPKASSPKASSRKTSTRIRTRD